MEKSEKGYIEKKAKENKENTGKEIEKDDLSETSDNKLKEQVSREYKKSNKKESKEVAEKINSQNDGQQNKLLRNVLIVSGIMLIVFLSGYFIMNSFKHFEYQGVTGDVVMFCDSDPCLTTYKTSLPVIYQGEKRDYNFYLRNNPEKLDSIPFQGVVNIETPLKKMVINLTEGLSCEGDDMIGVGNLIKLYGVLGIETIKDPNATCDQQGRYIFVRIQERNETNIEQFGPACYNINVANCEILKATERFMVETLVKVNEGLNK